MRTTDIATSIATTFKGHTTARALTNGGRIPHGIITLIGGMPLRGDITLNACIGGSSGCTGPGIPTTANRISGTISNLRQLRHDGTGVWVPYVYASTIPMAEGVINADGSFGGGPPTSPPSPSTCAHGSMNTAAARTLSPGIGSGSPTTRTAGYTRRRPAPRRPRRPRNVRWGVLTVTR